ncbi:MAG: rRNA maturation RNase YbeY [Chitinophagaceae bacterium]|jgi:rRNA maturation RNase YbeY|nr:rRNA maturation RNase YbeY [Chitinophagaceae bacterium]OQY92382.1 MAG: rRNA maturation RNase YbeY [Sphingobacteriales bacterium UTBCD1]
MSKPNAKPLINFFYPNKKYYLRNSNSLKTFIETIFLKEGKELNSMNYIFCSDNDLLKINKAYLNHNYFTDIITFNLSDNKEIIQGEAYISIDRVMANAKRMKISFKNELLRVIFHGSLHLCGYNDKTNIEAGTMREKEDYYLSIYTTI